MLSKIISGGQTGADRAALDSCLENGFPLGGSCPRDRLAEDGRIDRKYNLKEISGDYLSRTRKNVEDADGTVIFYERYLQGGTEQTVAIGITSGRPYKLIDIDVINIELAVDKILGFIKDHNICVLNVAGPRLSHCPAIYDYVKTAIDLVIQAEV